jgi:hypothetical protein
MLVAPDWTLRFSRVLAWPVVVLIAIVLFRRPVTQLVSGRALSRLKAGPFAAELEQRVEVDLDFADEGFDQQQAIALLGALNELFQVQIDFLKHLQQAADGLTSGAARDWFDAAGERMGIEEYDPEPGMKFLVERGLVILREDDRYVLAQFGQDLIELVEVFYYAPKLI